MEGRLLAGILLPSLYKASLRCTWCRTNTHYKMLLCRFMAFDRHMNLVLGDSEEFRKLPPKKGKSDDEVC